MRTSKKEFKKQIIEKISKMESNTFLFPKSWANMIDMIDYNWSYKTYNSGSVGINRYHNIEIHKEGIKIIDINFRSNDMITVVQDLAERQITLKDINYYITAIYDELHSFKNHNEGKRKIRKEISQKLVDIKTNQDELKVLRQQLIDSKTAI